MKNRNALLLSLGNQIKQARINIGISQETLADKCGFDRTYISLLERGKRNPSYLNLVKLSHGLGISLDKIIEVNIQIV